MSSIVRMLAMAGATPGAANATMPPAYMARPAKEIASVGISAPKTFAVSSSIVVTGVASSR